MRKIIVPFSRRAVSLCLVLAVLHLHSANASGIYAGASVPPAGELTTAGRVMVDGAPGIPGQTFFSGSTFIVAAHSLSALTLRNLSRLELSAETTLKLDFSDNNVTGALATGRLRVFAPSGINAHFLTAYASVLSEAQWPAIFSVQVDAGGTTVSVEAGQVRISVGDHTQLVSAGQFLSTSAGSQPMPTQRQPFSGNKRAGLSLGIVGVIAIIAAIITRTRNPAKPPRELSFGGCVVPPSPGANPDPPCR